MNMKLVPVTKDEARRFVTLNHRHNEAPSKMQVSLQVGLVNGNDELVGVATAGRPIARMLSDGVSLEVNRVCVLEGHKNANSMLYGAIARAAKALGYERLVTYTLYAESGSSLRAAGWSLASDVGARSWEKSNRPETRSRYDRNLFGERTNAAHLPKFRWEKVL